MYMHGNTRYFTCKMPKFAVEIIKPIMELPLDKMWNFDKIWHFHKM